MYQDLSLPCTRVIVLSEKRIIFIVESELNVFRFYIKFTRFIHKEKLSNSFNKKLNINGHITGEYESRIFQPTYGSN